MRILMTALMVMSLVISCSKVNHIQEKKEIVMSPFGTSLTKAVTIPLETSKEFGVYAFYADCVGGTAWNDPQAWEKLTT